MKSFVWMVILCVSIFSYTAENYDEWFEHLTQLSNNPKNKKNRIMIEPTKRQNLTDIGIEPRKHNVDDKNKPEFSKNFSEKGIN